MISHDSFQITPIPSEVAYFLSDAAKFRYEETDEKTKKVVVKEKLVRDKDKFNRYYFNYPPEWKTSNVGEMIVGVRSLWTLTKRRFLKYKFVMRKYKKFDLYDTARNGLKEKYGNMPYDTFINLKLSDEEIQDIINTMSKSDMDKIFMESINVISWLPVETDLRELFKDLIANIKEQTSVKYKSRFSILNKQKKDRRAYYKSLLKYTEEEILSIYDLDIGFNQSSPNDCDAQMDGCYEDKIFYEKIYSPRNINNNDPYYIDFAIFPGNNYVGYKYEYYGKITTPVNKESSDTFTDITSWRGGKNKSIMYPIGEFDNDVKAVFNIGKEPWQNSLDYVTTFHRELKFKNVYDRNSVKIHASFGNPSNNYYVGNSHVYFNPIKYYKLNAKDDKFWIEFYSGRHPDCPVNIPEDEGFVLEMLFMQNQKLLYT